MASSGVDNDTRGWIMCIVSGAACVAGASIICVDVLVRLIPSQRKFRIEDSSVFLACSLSLSFGVMLFSALYSMLPSSKKYLLKGGYGEQSAGFIMMVCFIAGFIGIQVISRVLHQFMPSHVVDCDHTHDEHALHDEVHADMHSRRPSRARRRQSSAPPVTITTAGSETNDDMTESTPLLPSENGQRLGAASSTSVNSEGLGTGTGTGTGTAHQNGILRPESAASDGHLAAGPKHGSVAMAQARRPSMMEVRNRVMSFVKDTKPNCDDLGPCYGYSDPCGQECFKHIGSRSALPHRVSRFLRTTTQTFHPSHHHSTTAFTGVPEDEEARSSSSCVSPTYRTSRAQSRDSYFADHHHEHHHDDHHHHDHHDHEEMHEGHEDDCCGASVMSGDKEAHHHHVPTNAFMAIGLQTVIAIALHKFPEGFITYATNHANPSLGFNVFMALFVHNIAEGFAMALPLYMALGSRVKAIAWSSLLGGLSQPLGAAIAVAWFKIASRNNFAIDNVAYACLFAITAGIMVSVALQLFVESLSLNHNRNLSIAFAFLGMTLLGFSNALVKD